MLKLRRHGKFVYIQLDKFTSWDGMPVLGSECISMEELGAVIRSLEQQLEAIRKQAPLLLAEAEKLSWI